MEKKRKKDHPQPKALPVRQNFPQQPSRWGGQQWGVHGGYPWASGADAHPDQSWGGKGLQFPVPPTAAGPKGKGKGKDKNGNPFAQNIVYYPQENEKGKGQFGKAPGW